MAQLARQIKVCPRPRNSPPRHQQYVATRASGGARDNARKPHPSQRAPLSWPPLLSHWSRVRRRCLDASDNAWQRDICGGRMQIECQERDFLPPVAPSQSAGSPPAEFHPPTARARTGDPHLSLLAHQPLWWRACKRRVHKKTKGAPCRSRLGVGTYRPGFIGGSLAKVRTALAEDQALLWDGQKRVAVARRLRGLAHPSQSRAPRRCRRYLHAWKILCTLCCELLPRIREDTAPSLSMNHSRSRPKCGNRNNAHHVKKFDWKEQTSCTTLWWHSWRMNSIATCSSGSGARYR